MGIVHDEKTEITEKEVLTKPKLKITSNKGEFIDINDEGKEKTKSKKSKSKQSNE